MISIEASDQDETGWSLRQQQQLATITRAFTPTTQDGVAPIQK